MKVLGRDQILKFHILTKVVLNGPDENGEETVAFVRALRAQEVDAVKPEDKPDRTDEELIAEGTKFVGFLIAKGVVDQNGNQLFDEDVDYAEIAKSMDPSTRDLLANAVMKASGVEVKPGKAKAEETSSEPVSSEDGPKNEG